MVLDASAALFLVVDVGERGDRARTLIAREGGELAAPHLVDAEVGQALRRLVRMGSVSPLQGLAALVNLGDLDIERFPQLPLLAGAFRLRENLTFYDALYVVLARALGCRLLTADSRLAGAPGAGGDVIILDGV